MKGNVINLNTLHLNSVRLNGIGKVQSVSLKGGSTEDPVFPPVEPPIEPEPTPTYTLSASVTNGMVSAKRNGSAVNLPFTANEGDVIVVSVTPNDGYAFEGWADGNTDNPRSITMNADKVLSAQCVEVVQPPVGNYIQFEDKAVEAICVANWSSDGIGLTEEDAAKVTSISNWFKGNTEITSFDEFRYFTGVKSLETSAFEGSSSLASLPLEHIANLNNKALYGCTALSYDELNLPNLTTLGQNAFYGVKIRKLNLGKLTKLPTATSSTQNFGDKSVLEEVVLSDNIVSIPDCSFSKYSRLSSVNVPESLSTIGYMAFYNCSSLAFDELYLPNVTTIGYDAFQGVRVRKIVVPKLTSVPQNSSTTEENFGVKAYLEEVEFGDALKSIGGNSFYNYTALKWIDLPASVTSIAANAFQRCTALQYVISRPTTPPTLSTNVFGFTNNCPIYVPDASVEAYKTATNWSSYASRIKGISEYNG